MKLIMTLIGGLLLVCTAPQLRAQTESCPDRLAARLLTAITSRDEDVLRGLANNPDVFDRQAIQYLIGETSFHFAGRNDLSSAYAVLRGKKLLTKTVVTESEDGSKIVEIVYLPTTTAPDFVGLAKIVESNRAILFRDYVMCSIIIRNGAAFMPHACYAETDALD